MAVDSNIGSLPAVEALDDDSLLVAEQQGEAKHFKGKLLKEFAARGVDALVEAAREAAVQALQAAEQAEEAAGKVQDVSLDVAAAIAAAQAAENARAAAVVAQSAAEQAAALAAQQAVTDAENRLQGYVTAAGNAKAAAEQAKTDAQSAAGTAAQDAAGAVSNQLADYVSAAQAAQRAAEQARDEAQSIAGGDFANTAYVDKKAKEAEDNAKAYVDEKLKDVGFDVSGITPEIANALLACFANVAWTTENGQVHYNALRDLLTSAEPEIPITSITAVFTQGNTTIFSDQELDDLKNYLAVTAYYGDGTSEVVTDYALSGELTAGTSEITVTYKGTTAAFDVTVTAFALPEGYTRYGYIEKNTISQSKVAPSSFIYLKAYEDMNVLSMEADLGSKPNVTTRDGAGLMGARLASGDGYPYYAVYWPDNASMWVGARNKKCTCALPNEATEVKLVVNNPATSPFSVKVNDGAAVECAWTNSPVIPHGMCLFNNIPDGSTSTFYINRHVRIGDILFRNADGECVGYYTPVTYDGKIGMYDQISKAFYTAETAAAVTVGNSGCLYAVGNWA